MSETNGIRGEERLIPAVRAHLAERFAQGGLRTKEIATALKVTQPAVSQYLKGKRGKGLPKLNHVDSIVSPLAERIVKRVRSGQGGLETMELLETARQLMVMNKSGPTMLTTERSHPSKNIAAMKLLRERLQLELKAAESYLELSNKISDEHTKLLLRLIASDSIRHGDIVSQIISWLEIGEHEGRFEPLNYELLKEMISLEDSASEVNLAKSIKTVHPIAKLLLEWIDADEEKHEKIVSKILTLRKNERLA